jgi:hypothetical protein
VSSEYVGEQLDAFGGGNVGQSQQAGVLGTAVNHPSEIGVDGDLDSVLPRRQFEDCLVAWVGAETGDFNYVVFFRPEPFGQTMASTAIDEESHLAS